MMAEQVKNVIVSIVLALVAYLQPIGGEILSLFLIFFLNFLFGYISAMVNGEDFSLKKALTCISQAAVFFVLATAVFAFGRLKGQETGALQCVSFITYVVLYFYGTNILRNLLKTFKEGTTPWMCVSFLYYVLRLKFVEHIPWLRDYLNKTDAGNEDDIK